MSHPGQPLFDPEYLKHLFHPQPCPPQATPDHPTSAQAEETASSNTTHNVVVFPDGSVTWVPVTQATTSSESAASSPQTTPGSSPQPSTPNPAKPVHLRRYRIRLDHRVQSDRPSTLTLSLAIALVMLCPYLLLFGTALGKQEAQPNAAFRGSWKGRSLPDSAQSNLTNPPKATKSQAKLD